jgi:hypothetical protein
MAGNRRSGVLMPGHPVLLDALEDVDAGSAGMTECLPELIDLEQKASSAATRVAARCAAAAERAGRRDHRARPFPLAIAPGAIVSGFSPLKSEINPLR